MKTEIKEISKLPNFLIILFAIQLIIFLFMFLKMENQDLTIFYILLPITLLLLITKMTIIFDSKTIKYQLFPINLNFKEINYSQIKELKISKVNALSDFAGWGLRYSKKNGWGYIFSSNDAIQITLNDHKKITITIKDKTEIINFLTQNNIPFTNQS